MVGLWINIHDKWIFVEVLIVVNKLNVWSGVLCCYNERLGEFMSPRLSEQHFSAVLHKTSGSISTPLMWKYVTLNEVALNWERWFITFCRRSSYGFRWRVRGASSVKSRYLKAHHDQECNVIMNGPGNENVARKEVVQGSSTRNEAAQMETS